MSATKRRDKFYRRARSRNRCGSRREFFFFSPKSYPHIDFDRNRALNCWSTGAALHVLLLAHRNSQRKFALKTYAIQSGSANNVNKKKKIITTLGNYSCARLTNWKHDFFSEFYNLILTVGVAIISYLAFFIFENVIQPWAIGMKMFVYRRNGNRMFFSQIDEKYDNVQTPVIILCITGFFWRNNYFASVRLLLPFRENRLIPRDVRSIILLFLFFDGYYDIITTAPHSQQYRATFHRRNRIIKTDFTDHMPRQTNDRARIGSQWPPTVPTLL